MATAIQLNLFTGEPIETAPVETKAEQIATSTRLALETQMAIARMEKFSVILKIITELCEHITGIAYSIDIDECQQTHLQKKQQEIQHIVPIETPTPPPIKKPVPQRKKKGRPKSLTREMRIQRNTEIRDKFFNREITQKQLAKDYNLAQTTVHNIIHRKAGQV